MATYQPIATGYKPEGALGALYAGENAAMARQQNQMANLADMFDQQQKELTYRRGEFDLGESQAMAPNVRATSNLAGAQATSMSTPEAIKAYSEGQLGGYQTTAAKGALDTALLPGAIATGKQGAHVTALLGVSAALKSGGKGAATNWVLNNYTDPDQRKALLNEVQGGTVDSALQQYALGSPTHIAAKDLDTAKYASAREIANINAASFANTADKQLRAAQLAADKLDLQSAEGAAKAALEAYKASGDELGKMIDQFKPTEKQSPRYLELLKQQGELRARMIETSNFIGSLRTPKPVTPGAPVPAVPVPAVAPPVTGSFVRDPKTGKLVLQQ